MIYLLFGGKGTVAMIQVLLLFSIFVGFVSPVQAATNLLQFNYGSRNDFLTDGWSYIARTGSGQSRDTETLVGSTPPDVSYNQVLHPGRLRIPVGSGDIWQTFGTSQNMLLRELATNWVSVRLAFSFAPSQNTEQLNLLIYQDDDNYVSVGRAYNNGHQVALVNELGGNAQIVGEVEVGPSNTNLYLRMDRDLNTGNVQGLFSMDGTNWNSLGQTWQTLINPKVGVFVGGAVTVNVNADLERLQIITAESIPPAVLRLQPQKLVFNTVVGQPLTNWQDLHLIVRGQDAPVQWWATNTTPWLLSMETNGITPGTCRVAVNTAGLAAGNYEAQVTFGGVGAVPATATVNLIVNPAVRAQVATWKNARRGAMTVSTDDSYSSGYAELKANNLRGTFLLWNVHPIPSLFTNAYLDGMELGTHTFNHYCFEVNEAAFRFQLEQNISGVMAATPAKTAEIISFAFPCGFNTIGEQFVTADYFLASRGYNINQMEDSSPANFSLLKSYNSHTYPPFPPGDFKTLVDAAIAQGKWFNLVLHEYNDEDGAIAYSVGKDIWVETLGSVTKYIVQRDRAVITNYVESAGQISFACYRLPIPASSYRSFEMAFTTNDTVTIKVSLTNQPASVLGVAVNGMAKPFSFRVDASSTNLLIDMLLTTNQQPVSISISTLPVLVATADTKSKVFGQPNPALTGSLSGVLGGDNITASFVTTATGSSAVGAYPISPTFSDPFGRLPNYNVVTNLGTLTVTKSNSPIQLLNLNAVYDGLGHAVDATTTPPGLPVAFTYAGSSIAPTNAGNYQVIGVINEANYVGAATNMLQIATRPLSAEANDASRLVGRSNPTFTGSISGVQAGDNISATFNSIAAVNSPAGSYAIVPSLSDPGQKLGNYAVSLTNGVLTVVESPRFTGASLLTGGVRLVCEVYPGRTYAFQFKNDLADPEWTTFVPNQMAIGTVVEIEDTVGTNSQRFYRAIDLSVP
ncbi:MAG: MBG domain-containing protein [Verrucomicrobiota bacterium]